MFRLTKPASSTYHLLVLNRTKQLIARTWQFCWCYNYSPGWQIHSSCQRTRAKQYLQKVVLKELLAYFSLLQTQTTVVIGHTNTHIIVKLLTNQVFPISLFSTTITAFIQCFWNYWYLLMQFALVLHQWHIFQFGIVVKNVGKLFTLKFCLAKY